jgi:anthranilate phosphoribosyltransferase
VQSRTRSPSVGSAESDMTDFSWPQTLSTLLAGRSLSEDEAGAAMKEIMEGAATPAQIAGFVIALRSKGETIDEIVGLVTTMRTFSEKIDVGQDVLDTCGTGGDRTGTFNVSTAAALVCAGAGVKVAKHGNRAASSRCGSADVLEALGVKIDLSPEGVAACIATAGIGFCFAPVFHPAMRHAGPPRKELGVATIFNFLGPLTNPAGATRQALGVSDPRMIEPMVEALGRLGSERVIAFHGDKGLDELATSGPSDVFELAEGTTRRWTVDPTDLGIESAPLEAVAGGSPDENAAAIRAVLGGEGGPRRDIVVLNAAAGLIAAGRAQGMPEGIILAAESIDSGAARGSLESLIAASNS